MKKLTFEEVKSKFEILPKEKMKQMIAGDGVILSGTGTQSDPYVISSTVYLNSVTFSGNNMADATNAIEDYNGMGPTNVNGKYYSFNISIKYEGPGSIPVQETYDTDNGQVSFMDTSVSQLSGTPSGGGNVVFGYEDPSNNGTGFYYQNMSGFMGAGTDGGFTQDELVQASVRHEIAHTFGLSDNDGTSVMQDFTSYSGALDSGSGPGQLDSTAISHMLSGGKIYWGSGVQH